MAWMKAGRWGLVAAALLSATLVATAFVPRCACEIEQDAGAPIAHDPMVVKNGKWLYVFTTGVRVPFRTSADGGKTWSEEYHAFDEVPGWAPATIPGFRDHMWAPDVSYFGGKWHLYYSVSTFGKNRSAIGHATNVTLEPWSPKYRWVDQGPVLQSNPTDDYNAIDPNVVVDAKGTPWLSFGSFWNGLRLVRLDREGRVADPGAKPAAIAARPHEGPQQPDAIEASFIYRHGGSYYLFASFDFCCRGVNSTYNVRVGRSKSVEGPYLDRDRKPMLTGGGTLVVEGAGRWHGTGHEAVFRDGRTEYLAYHAYDGEDGGKPKLRISKLVWDKDGWPTVER